MNSDTRPTPARRPRKLPVAPLTRADLPPLARVLLGRLEWYRSNRGRPCVSVRLFVRCPDCRAFHVFPWRWDWGTSPDVVSHQATPCPTARRPVWIALHPALQAETEETHAQAHADYLAWVQKRKRLKVEGSPGTRQELEPTPPAPPSPAAPAPTLGFFQPPAGLQPSATHPETTEIRPLETRSR